VCHHADMPQLLCNVIWYQPWGSDNVHVGRPDETSVTCHKICVSQYVLCDVLMRRLRVDERHGGEAGPRVVCAGLLLTIVQCRMSVLISTDSDCTSSGLNAVAQLLTHRERSPL